MHHSFLCPATVYQALALYKAACQPLVVNTEDTEDVHGKQREGETSVWTRLCRTGWDNSLGQAITEAGAGKAQKVHRKGTWRSRTGREAGVV